MDTRTSKDQMREQLTDILHSLHLQLDVNKDVPESVKTSCGRFHIRGWLLSIRERLHKFEEAFRASHEPPAEPVAWMSTINPGLFTTVRHEGETSNWVPLYRAAQPELWGDGTREMLIQLRDWLKSKMPCQAGDCCNELREWIGKVDQHISFHAPRASQPPPTEPTWPHPYGYIRSLLSEAVERAEADLMAVGHSQDGPERADAMKDLENWKAKLQDAWIHGDLEFRRAAQPQLDGEPLVSALIQAVKMERDEFNERDDESYSSDALMICKARVALCKAAVLAAMRPAPPPSPEWQPIETAPKDSKDFLGWECGAVGIYYRPADAPDDGAVSHGTACYPTHWMPLPSPPTKSGEQA